MLLAERDAYFFNKAKQFLIEQTPESITTEIVDSYLSVPLPTKNTFELNDIYYRLLVSAQNANMKAGVIGGSIKGVENLKHILMEFNPKIVLEKYQGREEQLLNDIVENLSPNGQIRRKESSLWPKYCRTIVSSALFINQFSDSTDFFEWANNLYKDKKTYAALPMLIEAEVYGIGFPLACDFLKELGYVGYGKPDTHTKQIFSSLKMINKNDSNYQILKSIVRIADNANVTPYCVDKVFWLIGSGAFYNHPTIGKKGNIGRMKNKFLEYVMFDISVTEAI